MIVPYRWIKTLDLENIHPFFSLLPSYAEPSSPPLSHRLYIFYLSLPDPSIDLPLSHTKSLSPTPANQWCSLTKMVLSLSLSLSLTLMIVVLQWRTILLRFIFRGFKYFNPPSLIFLSLDLFAQIRGSWRR